MHTNTTSAATTNTFIQTADGVLLEGKLEEYREAFNAVDNGGNGTISATEIAQLFQNLGTPLSYDKLVKMMATYDVDKSGQIDFYEFLRMFRDELLDLKEILEYIKMQPTQKTEQQAKVGGILARIFCERVYALGVWLFPAVSAIRFLLYHHRV